MISEGKAIEKGDSASESTDFYRQKRKMEPMKETEMEQLKRQKETRGGQGSRSGEEQRRVEAVISPVCRETRRRPRGLLSWAQLKPGAWV